MSGIQNTVLLFSGGLDSTSLLYHLRDEGAQIICVSIRYGQRHTRELCAATRICKTLGVEQIVADISSALPLFCAGALTGNAPVPDGHYTESSMKVTIVPNRNMIFLALATAAAITHRADSVAYAAHRGDHFIYPDCRPEFVTAMRESISRCDDNPPLLFTPFLELTKAQIVARGAMLGVPFAETWSCYKGGDTHCGTCGTCVERREAFTEAEISDPTIYG